MSAPSVKSKDAYEEGLSTVDSDELQLVKIRYPSATLRWEGKEKTLSGG
jgi:hypothetical protein